MGDKRSYSIGGFRYKVITSSKKSIHERTGPIERALYSKSKFQILDVKISITQLLPPCPVIPTQASALASTQIAFQGRCFRWTGWYSDPFESSAPREPSVGSYIFLKVWMAWFFNRTLQNESKSNWSFLWVDSFQCWVPRRMCLGWNSFSTDFSSGLSLAGPAEGRRTQGRAPQVLVVLSLSLLHAKILPGLEWVHPHSHIPFKEF